jgi:pilus assembly protein CpaB
MRAIAVKTNEVMNMAGFIFPGSRVDVLMTLRGESNDASTTTARTVLQNVQVLSTGNEDGSRSDRQAQRASPRTRR